MSIEVKVGMVEKRVVPLALYDSDSLVLNNMRGKKRVEMFYLKCLMRGLRVSLMDRIWKQ